MIEDFVGSLSIVILQSSIFNLQLIFSVPLCLCVSVVRRVQRFFLVQASMRCRAIWMLSIELATLKRR
jgi:hypothetical protein